MWQDLHYAVRALRRSPVFTAAAVLSLALGIGANSAIFTLLDQVVLRSLPVAEPERLVALHGSYSGPGTNSSSWSTNSGSVFPYPLYRDLRARVPEFSGLIASALAPVRVGLQGETHAGDAVLVSGNYFSTLGVRAAAGRLIEPPDDSAAGASPVAVLGHAFWSGRLGGQSDVVNRKITINGTPFVVVGVADAAFKGLVQGEAADVYIPLAMQRAVMPTVNALEDRNFSWLNFFARLQPGSGMARAQSATDAVYRATIADALSHTQPPPDAKERASRLKSRLELRPAAHGITDLREKWEKPLAVLMIMVGLLLLLACANVAGLLIARAAGRQREMAIRLALGARRITLIKQLLIEGVMLALAGAVAALMLQYACTAGLLYFLPRDATAGWVRSGLDVRMLGFTLGLSALSTACFALLPAWTATRPDVAVTLKDQAGNISAHRHSARLRRLLVTAQVAVSLLLVVGAGLFSSSAANLLHASRGFRTEHLLLLSVNATLVHNQAAPAAAFYQDLRQRLAALPGVGAVAASDAGPYSGAGFGSGIKVEGYQPEGKQGAGSSLESITPGYFHTLDIALRSGREFSERDTAASPKVAVVNEAFVGKYFAGRNPLGRRVGFITAGKLELDREVVGVVADVRGNVRGNVLGKPQPTIYFPYTQREQPARLMFYVHTAGDPTGLTAAIRRTVRECDAGQPVPEIKAIDLRIRESLSTQRLVAALSTAFGVLATLLAAVGLYGVIAFVVARRSAEIGIRMALGASRASVLKLVLLDAGWMAGAGIGVGAAAALALGRFVESQLFGVKAADPVVLVAAAVALVAVCLAAAGLPAWRAARIDPLSALRFE